jgi:hypothetical protein
VSRRRGLSWAQCRARLPHLVPQMGA